MNLRAWMRLLLVAWGLGWMPAQHASALLEVVVEPTQIRIGAEVVPRFAVTDPGVHLVVPGGETVTLPADANYDAIEVAGTLRVRRDGPTFVRFQHLIILPGGRLDAGTPEDPVRHSVVFAVRRVPLDPDDVHQWGNGILVFGRFDAHGAAKTRWTTGLTGFAAGASSITVASTAGWQVGDVLDVVDTQQAGTYRTESPVTVAGLSGQTVTLSKPLDFAHAPIRDVNGAVVVLPRVLNLTSTLEIRSAEGFGVAGHLAQIGPQATADLRYVTVAQLGRTRADPLHPVTNRIGKYADHLHHTQGLGSVRIGNVYLGDYTSKWAVAVHRSHDAVIADNVCVAFAGSCFVTEDGPEVRIVWQRNLALRALGNALIHPHNLQAGCPGCEGSGFWLNGLHSGVIEGNEAWNNRRGFMLAGQRDVLMPGEGYPSQPGGPHDAPFDPNTAIPASVRGNLAAVNEQVGVETWQVPTFPIDDLVSVANGSFERGRDFTGQFWNAGIGGTSILRHARLLSTLGPTPHGLGALAACVLSSSYTFAVEIEDAELSGCHNGIEAIGGYVNLTHVRLQNAVNLEWDWIPGSSRLEDVTFHDIPQLGPGIKMRFGPPAGTEPYHSHRNARAWNVHAGSRHQVINWDGTEADYRLYEADQRGSTLAHPWAARVDQWEWKRLLPFANLTMGEAWDRFGLALWGEAVPDGEAIPLDGVVNGFARAGLGPVVLGPPRAVLTWPNTLVPATVEHARSWYAAYLTLTGDPTGMSPRVCLSHDGGPVTCHGIGDPNENTATTRTLRLGQDVLLPGPHVTRTWRETADGQRVNPLEFAWCAQTCEGETPPVPPPPPPPPPPGPCVVDTTVEAFGSVWTFGTSTDGGRTASILRDGQPTGASDGAPFAFVFDGSLLWVNVYPEPQENWFATDGGTFQQKRGQRPSCGG